MADKSVLTSNDYCSIFKVLAGQTVFDQHFPDD